MNICLHCLWSTFALMPAWREVWMLAQWMVHSILRHRSGDTPSP